MVKAAWKMVVIAVALLVFGVARVRFETKLGAELREAGLFPPPIEIGTREKIGQTSSAVALGGLRTLVATFLNLRAFTFFTEQRWEDVESTFETIVDLAPRTRYYWETGSWHMAYNAASYHAVDSKLPALRRREAWRTAIIKGRAFLERGARNNPGDWSIPANLGFLLSDPNKLDAFRDSNASFAAAADAYGRSAATGNALAYVKRAQFYALARVEGREAEALALGRELYQKPKNRAPTLLVLLVVLEAWENPQMDVAGRAIEVFGSPEKAYKSLTGHWRRTRQRFPVYGVASALESLEKTLSIPAEKSIFNEPPSPPFSPDEWFSK